MATKKITGAKVVGASGGTGKGGGMNGNSKGIELPEIGAETQTLETLLRVFPSVDAEAASLALDEVPEDVLLEYGVSVDSQLLLDSVPGFVASALRILGALRGDLAALVLIDRGLFSVLVHETARLETMHRRWVEMSKQAATVKTQSRQDGERVVREALALRVRIAGALRSVLGPKRGHAVDTAASGGDDEVPLAGGLMGLAQLLGGLRKDARVANTLRRYGLGEDTQDELRSSAKAVRALSAPYTQAALKADERALNLQDGRVIVVAEKIVRAFRHANRSNPAVLLPALGGLAWRLGTRSGRRGGSSASGKEPVGPVEPLV